MFLHRLIKIHRLQNGGIETCQQFGGDDQEFERVVGIAEVIENGFFLIFAPVIGAIIGFHAAVNRHDNLAG
ncbi:MAG: hypothetical protein K8F25_04715, partial [Fimbriimonadaceae bacterium]|nr:hypothetical protein [Alphaproteobacteria bacterium]